MRVKIVSNLIHQDPNIIEHFDKAIGKEFDVTGLGTKGEVMINYPNSRGEVPTIWVVGEYKILRTEEFS